jgi:hypothetical protein
MWNQTWTDRLKQDLFLKYDKFARPTEHFNTTVVKFDLSVCYFDVASMRDIKMYNKCSFYLSDFTTGFSFDFQDDFKSTVTVTAWARFVCAV